MSQNTSSIHLEIFIPSFALPGRPAGQVQAQLLLPSTRQILHAQQATQPEPRAQQGTEMRQLRVQNIPPQGEAFLLQILRQWSKGGGAQPAQLSDEIAFTLELRTTNTTTEQAHVIPGLHRIVILLDKDERPASARIDSVES